MNGWTFSQNPRKRGKSPHHQVQMQKCLDYQLLDEHGSKVHKVDLVLLLTDVIFMLYVDQLG